MASPSKRKCVITGMGVISPIATTYAGLVHALRTGADGVGRFTRVDVKDLECQRGGEVKRDIDEVLVQRGVEPARVAQYCRFTKLALAAAFQAIDDAALDTSKVDPARTATLFATTLGPSDIVEHANITWMTTSRRLPVLMLSQQWLSTAVTLVLGELGLTCESHVLSHGCSAANYALTFACSGIRNGHYDVALVGGADTLSKVCLVAYERFAILADRSLPLDARRKGMVCSEGAAMLVLESEEHALKRGAYIYAELAGGATTADAFQLLSPRPDGDGLYRAMVEALAMAEVRPEDVDYISACASGTPLGDKAEARAIRRLFEPTGRVPPVSATKSQMGHTHGASSAIEAIVCVAAIENGLLPASINVTEPDEDCTFDVVPEAGREQAIKVALSNASAFGGADSCIVLRRYASDA